jgi:hypothetical protein
VNVYPEGTVYASDRVSYELNTADVHCARF